MLGFCLHCEASPSNLSFLILNVFQETISVFISMRVSESYRIINQANHGLMPEAVVKGQLLSF